MFREMSTKIQPMLDYMTKVLGVKEVLLTLQPRLLVIDLLEEADSSDRKQLLANMLKALNVASGDMQVQTIHPAQKEIVLAKATHVEKIPHILVLAKEPIKRGELITRGPCLILETFSPERLQKHPAEKRIVWNDLKVLIDSLASAEVKESAT
jgi:hypothetical protein